MIRLDTQQRKLQAFLGGAVATTSLDVVACFFEFGNEAQRREKSCMQLSRLSGATPVDIVDAPPAVMNREIDYLSINNNDSAAATVTVRLNDNGTFNKPFVVTLAVGDSLHFGRAGWSVMDSSGAIKR